MRSLLTRILGESFQRRGPGGPASDPRRRHVPGLPHGALLALAGHPRTEAALVVVDEDAERALFFRQGEVVGATSNVLFERLGRVLYKSEVVTHDGRRPPRTRRGRPRGAERHRLGPRRRPALGRGASRTGGRGGPAVREPGPLPGRRGRGAPPRACLRRPSIQASWARRHAGSTTPGVRARRRGTEDAGRAPDAPAPLPGPLRPPRTREDDDPGHPAARAPVRRTGGLRGAPQRPHAARAGPAGRSRDPAAGRGRGERARTRFASSASAASSSRSHRSGCACRRRASTARGRSAAPRRLAGEQRVARGGQSVDVLGGCGRAAPARGDLGSGEARRAHRLGRPRELVLRRPGPPVADQHGRRRRRDDHVLGGDLSVHDTSVVEVLERAGERVEDRQDPLRASPPSPPRGARPSCPAPGGSPSSATARPRAAPPRRPRRVPALDGERPRGRRAAGGARSPPGAPRSGRGA